MTKGIAPGSTKNIDGLLKASIDQLTIPKRDPTEAFKNTTIAPAPSVSNNRNKISQDNDINITVNGTADVDMLKAGISRVQRVHGAELMRAVQGSVR